MRICIRVVLLVMPSLRLRLRLRLPLRIDRMLRKLLRLRLRLLVIDRLWLRMVVVLLLVVMRRIPRWLDLWVVGIIVDDRCLRFGRRRRVGRPFIVVASRFALASRLRVGGCGMLVVRYLRRGVLRGRGVIRGVLVLVLLLVVVGAGIVLARCRIFPVRGPCGGTAARCPPLPVGGRAANSRTLARREETIIGAGGVGSRRVRLAVGTVLALHGQLISCFSWRCSLQHFL